MAFKSEPLRPWDTVLGDNGKGFDSQRCQHLNAVLPQLKGNVLIITMVPGVVVEDLLDHKGKACALIFFLGHY